MKRWPRGRRLDEVLRGRRPARLFSRLRQVDALGGEFGGPFDQPADAAFAFVSGKRRVEQLADLFRRQIFEIERFGRGGDRGRSGAQAKLCQPANGVRAGQAMGFSPSVDFGRQLFRHSYRADRSAR